MSIGVRLSFRLLIPCCFVIFYTSHDSSRDTSCDIFTRYHSAQDYTYDPSDSINRGEISLRPSP